MTEQEAFDKAIVERCRKIVTVPQDFEAGWKAALEWARTQQKPAMYGAGYQFTSNLREAQQWERDGFDVELYYAHPAPQPDISELVNILTDLEMMDLYIEPISDKEMFEFGREVIRKALAKWESKDD